jgi:drug/metabolite transporter (DMT)-like permease
MNQAGIIFALLTTLSWSIGIFPFTIAARRLGANTLNHFRLPVATLLIFLITYLVTGREGIARLFSSEFISAWFWLGLSGLVGLTIGDHYGFGAFAILGPRLGSVMSSFAPGAALVTGYFLTGDRLSFIGVCGIFITMFGVMFLSLGRDERRSHSESPHGSMIKGIVLGILSAFCQGAGLVLAKRGLMSIPEGIAPVAATFIRLSAATLSLFIFSMITGSLGRILLPLRNDREKGITPALLGTLFGPVIGVSLSLYTVSLLEASVAQTIFSLVPVTTLVLNTVIHRERMRFKMIAGVLVAVGGVMLLVWRDPVDRLIFH